MRPHVIFSIAECGERGCQRRYAWLQAIIDAPIDTPGEKATFLMRSSRLRELAALVDDEARMRVARPVVEGCRVAFEIPCKMDWARSSPPSPDLPELSVGLARNR